MGREGSKVGEWKKSEGEGDNMCNCSPRPSDRDWFNGIRVAASSAIIIHSGNVHPPLVLWHTRSCVHTPSSPVSPSLLFLRPRLPAQSQRYEFRNASCSQKRTVQVRWTNNRSLVVLLLANNQLWLWLVLSFNSLCLKEIEGLKVFVLVSRLYSIWLKYR